MIVETENHIIQCQIYSRQQLRKTWIIELSNYLSKPHTPVSIKDAIITHLTKWLEIGKYIVHPINDETNHNINNTNNTNINNSNNDNNNVDIDTNINNINHTSDNTIIMQDNNNNHDYNNDNDEIYNAYDNDDYNDDYIDSDNNNDDSNIHDGADNVQNNNKQFLQPKDSLAETIIIQNRIGWNNFIRG